MLLLPGSPVLTRALSPGPCAAPAPPWLPLGRGSPGTGLGLCAAWGARTALKQSPAPSALQPPCFTSSSPRYSPKRVLHRALGPAVLRKAPTGAALWCHCRSLAHGHGELFCTPRERSCGCCSRARAMEPPTRRELPQHPCDSIDQTRPRRSRGSLKWPRDQGTPGWAPIPSTQPDTSATTPGVPTCCFGANYLHQRLIVHINSQINPLQMILNNGLGLGIFERVLLKILHQNLVLHNILITHKLTCLKM